MTAAATATRSSRLPSRRLLFLFFVQADGVLDLFRGQPLQGLVGGFPATQPARDGHPRQEHYAGRDDSRRPGEPAVAVAQVGESVYGSVGQAEGILCPAVRLIPNHWLPSLLLFL